MQYPSMQEALKDCCGNVWAIVEIVGPNGGYDCSHFRDTGGTRYKSPHESVPLTNFETESRNGISQLNDLLENTGVGSKTAENTARSSKMKAERTVRRSGSISRSGFRSHLLDGSEGHEQSEDNEQEPMLNVVELKAMMGLGPSITVRMLPSAIPDTRNFEYDQLYLVFYTDINSI